jgi:type I restriction enzyme S subunit
MSELVRHKFADLYEMGSGISSKPEQAGHGAPFLSFSTVFNNYFLPSTFTDRMDTSEQEQKKYSINEGDIFLTRTSEVIDELGMSSVALKNYPQATYSGFLKRLRPTKEGGHIPKIHGVLPEKSFVQENDDKQRSVDIAGKSERRHFFVFGAAAS